MSLRDDKTHWAAFAYDDPDINESILLVFRMEDAKEDTFTVKLPFAEKGAKYELKDADSGKAWISDGEELSKTGIKITLNEPKTSALVYIERI